MGIVLVASLAGRVTADPAETMISNLEAHEFGYEVGKAIWFPLSKPPLYDNVLVLYVTKLTQALPEGLDASPDSGRRDQQLGIQSAGLLSAAAPRQA